MFMDVWVELFIIGWVNMFCVGWVEVSILSLVGAATSMSFVATRLLSRQTYACRDKIMFVAIKRFSRQIFVAKNTCLSRQADCCLDKRQHTFVATKKNKKKTYLQKSYLWQLPPVIIYLGQLASLQPSELTCFWSSELTGIFRVEWIDISMVGWVDMFMFGWVDIGELVSLLLW